MDKRFCVVEKGFSAVEKGFSAVEKGFSAVEKGFSAVEKGFSVADKGFCVVEKGFCAVQKTFSAVEKGFSVVEAPVDVNGTAVFVIKMPFSISDTFIPAVERLSGRRIRPSARRTLFGTHHRKRLKHLIAEPVAIPDA